MSKMSKTGNSVGREDDTISFCFLFPSRFAVLSVRLPVSIQSTHTHEFLFQQCSSEEVCVYNTYMYYRYDNLLTVPICANEFKTLIAVYMWRPSLTYEQNPAVNMDNKTARTLFALPVVSTISNLPHHFIPRLLHLRSTVPCHHKTREPENRESKYRSHRYHVCAALLNAHVRQANTPVLPD